MIERLIKFCFALLLIVPISAIVLGQTIGPPPSSGGGGAATCGSQALGVCFNSSGAFSSSSDFVVDTTNHVMTAGALSGSAYSGGFGAQKNGFANGSPGFGLFNDSSALNTGMITDVNANIEFLNNGSVRLMQTNGAVLGGQTGQLYGWGTISGVPATVTLDTAIARNAAAVVEVDNGTAGTYGDIKLNKVQVGTIYSAAGTPLPSCAAGINGATAIVSDATSATYRGNYSSGGAQTARVLCVNGTGWITD